MNNNKPKSTGSETKHSLRFEETSDDTRTIIPNQSIIFSNWYLFRKQIEQIGPENGKNVILNLSETVSVEHKVLNKLREMQSEFTRKGLYLKLTLTKKDHKCPKHPFVKSKKWLQATKRITIFADPSLKTMIEEELKKLGIIDITSMDCVDLCAAVNRRLRIEVLSEPELANRITKYIQEKLLSEYAVRAYEEDV
jgi:hypothetical protein